MCDLIFFSEQCDILTSCESVHQSLSLLFFGYITLNGVNMKLVLTNYPSFYIFYNSQALSVDNKGFHHNLTNSSYL